MKCCSRKVREKWSSILIYIGILSFMSTFIGIIAGDANAELNLPGQAKIIGVLLIVTNVIFIFSVILFVINIAIKLPCLKYIVALTLFISLTLSVICFVTKCYGAHCNNFTSNLHFVTITLTFPFSFLLILFFTCTNLKKNNQYALDDEMNDSYTDAHIYQVVPNSTLNQFGDNEYMETSYITNITSDINDRIDTIDTTNESSIQ